MATRDRDVYSEKTVFLGASQAGRDGGGVGGASRKKVFKGNSLFLLLLQRSAANGAFPNFTSKMQYNIFSKSPWAVLARPEYF